ncbi:MAG TPA: hypothetical protein QGF05_04600 [Dehalococcoidia bacterium]|nr:hypothetical protein [Dehalococcoidia bacterium]
MGSGAVADQAPLRDIYRKGWSGLASLEALQAAVDELAACHWCRIEEIPSGEAGGRPSQILRLHPELRTGGS